MFMQLKPTAAAALVLVSAAMLPTTRGTGLGGVAASEPDCISRVINFEDAEDFLDMNSADDQTISDTYGDDIGITFRVMDQNLSSITVNGEILRPVFEKSGNAGGDSSNGFWGNVEGAHDSLVEGSVSMDKYFLRTYALGSSVLNEAVQMVPSLLISYNGEGTTSATGEIYDIDGNGLDNSTGYARNEEWTIIAYDADMVVLGSIVSPRGTGEEIRSAHPTKTDAMGNPLRVDSNDVVSYDSTNWYWAIDATALPGWPDCETGKCPAHHIEIRYTGDFPEDRPSSVGLAFDNFAAHACIESEVGEPEEPEWSDWSEWGACDVVDLERCGQEGYQRSVRTKVLQDNQIEEEFKKIKCGNWEPCPECEYGEFGEWTECEYEVCGALGIKTRTKVSLEVTNHCIPPADYTEEATCAASTCCHLPIDFEDATEDNANIALDRYVQDKFISFRSITNDCDLKNRTAIENGDCNVIDPKGLVSYPKFESADKKDKKHGFVGSASKGRDRVLHESVQLDNYFMRTYDLGDNKWNKEVGFVPTLLISYSSYTLAASGHIYDIDGSSWDGSKSNTRQEQWKITAWGHKDGEYVELKEIESPRGNSNGLKEFHATETDAVGNPLRMKVDKKGREIISYDSVNWEWKFNAATDAEWPRCAGNVTCAVSDITIEFIGQYPKNRPTSVGLAFDNFDAFGCADPNAPPPPEPPVPCEYTEWVNGTICNVTKCDTTGVYTDTREAIRENNCFAPHNANLTRQITPCPNDPCVCTYTEFDEGECSVNKANDGCGKTGVIIKHREVKNSGTCPYLEDENISGAEMELRRKEKLEQITTEECSTELCPCDIAPFEDDDEYECQEEMCGITGEMKRTTGYIVNSSCIDDDTLYEEYYGIPPVFEDVSDETCFTPCNCTVGEWSDPICSTEEVTCGSIGVWYQTREVDLSNDCDASFVSTYREIEDLEDVAKYNSMYGSCSAAPCCVLTEWTEPTCDAQGCGNTSVPLMGRLMSNRSIDTSIEGCINGTDITASTEFTMDHGECTAPTCDCEPGEWSDWTCSADEQGCGQTGTNSRTRSYEDISECKMPEGAQARYISEGESDRADETVPGRACATAPCCGYSEWTTTCEADTCGEAARLVKRRTFDPNSDGCEIPEDLEDQLVEDNQGACELVPGDWSAWSECECGQESERFVCFDPNHGDARRQASNMIPLRSSRQTRTCCECSVGNWSPWVQVSDCGQINEDDDNAPPGELEISCTREDDTSFSFKLAADNSNSITQQNPEEVRSAQETLDEIVTLLQDPTLTPEERKQAERERNNLNAGIQCSNECNELGTQECTEEGLAPINYARDRNVVEVIGDPECPALNEACLCACQSDDDDNTALIAGLATAGAAVLLAAAGAVMYFTNSAGAAQATANSGDMFNDLQNQHNPMFENPTNTFYNDNYAPGAQA